MTDLVHVEHLHNTYVTCWRHRRVEAVRGISFSVQRGEIFGIVGPNGAGKTTTLKVLTGLVRPSSGVARLMGKPVHDVESRRRLGYLPEGPYFYEHLNVVELLSFYGSLLGVPRQTLRERAERLIAEVGLEHARTRPIRKFSKGMRQRAGFAQALNNDPELVILDEPQTGLDPVGRKDVRDLIFRLKSQGKTVVISSHILPDVEAVCDRVAVLHRGEIQEIGSLHELTSERTAYYEFIVRNVSESLVRGLDSLRLVEARGDVLMLRFDPGIDLPEVFARLVALGAQILSMNPHRENLEDVFLRDTYGRDASPQEES